MTKHDGVDNRGYNDNNDIKFEKFWKMPVCMSNLFWYVIIYIKIIIRRIVDIYAHWKDYVCY